MSATKPTPPAKEALLKESLRLFASRGVDAVSVREIAHATGFSNPALFRHFATKEALAEALFEDCYGRLVDVLSATPAEGGIEAWLVGALTEINDLPEGVLFVLDNLKRYWHRLPDPLKDRNLPRLAIEMIKREQAAGRVRGDIAPNLVATVLFGTLGQIARSVHFKETRIDPATFAMALGDFLGRGLIPRP